MILKMAKTEMEVWIFNQVDYFLKESMVQVKVTPVTLEEGRKMSISYKTYVRIYVIKLTICTINGWVLLTNNSLKCSMIQSRKYLFL